MSRSYGKPHTPFHIAYLNDIEELKKGEYYIHDNWNYTHNFGRKPTRWFNTWDDVKEARWKYRTKKHTCHRHSYRFPKSYRKEINKNRTMVDKRELYKELNTIDYEGMYSTWNCKDADPWYYW